VVAVPLEWTEFTVTAVRQLAQDDAGEAWQVIAAEAPAELLSNQAADIALIRGTTGALAIEEHLALTVPFTTAWENVSEFEAQDIVINGHPLVTVVQWNKVQSSAKALRIDGRWPGSGDYQLKESWSLQAAKGHEEAALALATGLRAHFAARPMVHVAAVGDIMLDRALGYALQNGDLAYPFEQVVDTLSAADITIGNLESALGSNGEAAAKHYTFRAPPEAASALKRAGFDVITLANNHALDYGQDALIQGLSILREQGIDTIGAGENAEEAYSALVHEVNDVSIAFLGYVNVPVEVGGFDTETWTASAESAGLAWGTADRIKAGVASIAQFADIVVVVLHSGYEYVEAPSEPQMDLAHAAIEAGAVLVIGHHAHVLQGIEFYKEGVIVYGLGNFAFEITGPPESAILNVWLDRNGVRQIEIVPVIVQPGGQPRLAQSWEAVPIRERVYRLTDQLNVP
jgi:poly-gamma-glutamate synthesis protein (capsule biosynthesis protein)